MVLAISLSRNNISGKSTDPCRDPCKTIVKQVESVEFIIYEDIECTRNRWKRELIVGSALTKTRFSEIDQFACAPMFVTIGTQTKIRCSAVWRLRRCFRVVIGRFRTIAYQTGYRKDR